MKKLVILSVSQIEYVAQLAKSMGDPRGKGNFSKALQNIIDKHMRQNGRQI